MNSSPSKVSEYASYESGETGREQEEGARSVSSAAHWDAERCFPWNPSVFNSTARADSAAAHWESTLPWDPSLDPTLDDLGDASLDAEEPSMAVTYSVSTEFDQHISQMNSIAPPAIDCSGFAATRSSEPEISAFLRRPVYETISAEVRADENLGNYSYSQDLISAPSTPPPVVEQDLISVGQDSRSSKKPSTVIGKSSERKDSPTMELDTLSSPYRPMEKDTRITSDLDVMESRQRNGAKVTRIVNACANCRRKRHVCEHQGKPTFQADTMDAITLLNPAHQKGERQNSSEFSGNAEDRGFPMPDTVVAMEQLDYAEDLMQSIRSRVLKIRQARQPPKMKISLAVPCDVRGFMEKQFQGSNKSLGQVIVLSGTATYGQATTCSGYIHSNWPLRGPWLLNLLQLTFDGCGEAAEDLDSDVQVCLVDITNSSVIKIEFIGSNEAAIDVLQLFVWFGAAFQVSSSDQLQHIQSKLHMFGNPPWGHLNFTVDYEKLPVSEQSCWFSLFNNPVITRGFPVPERRNAEQGLELPIELMATLGGGRHAIEFEGGLVIKGPSMAFFPVQQFEDTIQWHMISNSDGTRLRYSDLRIPRALLKEVNFEAIWTKRVVLGWSQVAQTLLGSETLNRESIDWSEAKEAGRSTRLSGGGLGFQSNLIGQLNFALGAKDGRLLLSQNGPFVKIIDLAEKTPVVLYDHGEKRAWLVPALEVIHHVIQTRLWLYLYTDDISKAKFFYSDETAKISDQAARRAVMASKDQQLYECTMPGEKAYYVRDAVLDIWSLLERMMERDAMITSTPGIAVQGTWREKLYGWEFRALVEDKNSFRRKEQVLEKTNGGWVDLVDDTDTIVLFGNGFQEVIKPVTSCSAWKSLPKWRDYLAVGCPMLETLYNEAGSRKTRSFLTSRHLQWHRGSTLFESCEGESDCTCDRLQQLVFDSKITFRRVSPPNELPPNGCVIFGRAHHPMLHAKRTYAKQQEIRSIPSGPLPEAQLIKPEPGTHPPTTSLGLRLDRDQLPDGKDSSSVLDRPASPAGDESESEHRGLALKRRRNASDRDAGGGNSLYARQKKSLFRRSSLLCILRSPSKISRDKMSNLENKDSSEVKAVALDEKDPMDRTPGSFGGDAAFDNDMHCQSGSKLDCNSEVEEDMETRHASTAVNCSK